MGKFATNLSTSNKEIRSDRADMLSDEVENVMNQFVGKLRGEKIALKNKIIRLTDLAPDSKDSLRPGGDNFDPQKWVESLHEMEMDLELKTVEFETAEKMQKEWFTDEEK